MKASLMVVFLVVCSLFWFGCKDQKQEFSQTLHEDAIVEDVIFTASHIEPRLQPKLVPGMGIGIGSGLEITVDEVPESYAVVFRCKHGQFIITRKEIYVKLKAFKGRTVDVAYREEYRTTYEKKDGKKQVVERALVKYDFLDANLK